MEKKVFRNDCLLQTTVRNKFYISTIMLKAVLNGELQKCFETMSFEWNAETESIGESLDEVRILTQDEAFKIHFEMCEKFIKQVDPPDCLGEGLV